MDKQEHSAFIGIDVARDRLDAEAIAAFAEAVRPDIRPLPSTQERRLSALSRRRLQVVTMLAACMGKLLIMPNAIVRDQKEWKQA